MANNDKKLVPYRRISVIDRKDRGESFTVKQRFAQALQKEGFKGAEARFDSDQNTVLYFPAQYLENKEIEHTIEHTIKGLERDLKSKTVKLAVSEVIFNDNGQDYEKMKGSYEQAQQHLTELEGKLEESNKRYSVTIVEKESLEREKHNLEERLADAEQEQAIANLLYHTADLLDSIPSYPQQAKVEEANKIKQQKEEYLQKHGLAAIEALPEEIQKQILDRWKEGDSTLEEYKNYLQAIQPRTIPVRLATTLENYVLVFPWSLQPQHDSLKDVSERIQENLRSQREGELKEENSLTVATLSPQQDKNILKQELANIMGEGSIILIPSWIETDYFAGIPGRAQQKTSFYEFIMQRSKEKGYIYAKDLANAAGISPTTLSRINQAEKTGEEVRLEKPTIAKLATALETTQEELRSYLQHSQ